MRRVLRQFYVKCRGEIRKKDRVPGDESFRIEIGNDFNVRKLDIERYPRSNMVK